MVKITVLGAGLVGSAMIKDLAQEADFRVTAVDVNPTALEALTAAFPVRGICADVREPGQVAALAAEADLVISAVPGFMGFETLRRIIEARKNVVDISFFPEDAFLLDELAQAQGVTAVVDCGVAPGLCNIIAGYVSRLLTRMERYICYVGGLPLVRRWPYEYKAVFSPADVLEEYTRPARFVEYGQEVIRPALSDAEQGGLPSAWDAGSHSTRTPAHLAAHPGRTLQKEKTLPIPATEHLMPSSGRAALRHRTAAGDASPAAYRAHGPSSLRPVAVAAGEELHGNSVNVRATGWTLSATRMTCWIATTRRCRPPLWRGRPATTATITSASPAGAIAQRTSPPEFVGRTLGVLRPTVGRYAKGDHVAETVVNF
jgi:hypothetical protein